VNLLEMPELIDAISVANERELRVILKAVSAEVEANQYDWHKQARPNQLPPEGDWLIWLIMAGRGFGKALALDTPIPTPTGWTTMGEISPGDWVFDENGEPCQVTYATEIQLKRECFKVHFDDGSEIVADAEHRWLTWDRQARKAYGRSLSPRNHPAVRTTREIAETVVSNGERNHSIEVAKPLRLPPVDLSVDPYLLGIWLGDGSSAAGEVTIGDEDAAELLEELAAVGAAITGAPRRNEGSHAATYPIGGMPQQRDGMGRMTANGSLHSRLKDLGVLRNKHIPANYLRAAESQRFSLLQGLMDSDGFCAHGGHVEFCTTKEALARSAFDLIISLGFKARIAESRATLYGKDCGPRWRITWTTNQEVFRLTRKSERLRSARAQNNRTTHRYITKVEPIQSVPVRCLTVNSPSHLFLAGSAMIPTHNTRTGAEWIKQEAIGNPGTRWAVVAPTFADIRDTCFEGVSGLVNVIPPAMIKDYNRSMAEIVLTNGSRIKGFSAAEPDRLRGPQHHGAWCDELAAFVYPEAFDQLMFGLRLGDRPKCIVTTTPKPTALLKDLIQRETVSVTRGSIYDNAANLSDSALAELENRYGGTRIGRQELYGELLDDVEGALATLAEIDAIRIPRASGDYLSTVVGVDPAVTNTADSDATGISVQGLRADGHVEIIDDKSIKASVSDWASLVVRLAVQHNAGLIIYEANQGGDAIGQLLRQALRNAGQSTPIKSVTASKSKFDRALVLQQGIQQQRVSIVGSLPQLEDELTTWTIDSKVSPNSLDAAVHAYKHLASGVGRGLIYRRRNAA
jgi:phage terminase large subunit-like protein